MPVDERGELDVCAVEDAVQVDWDERAEVECAEFGEGVGFVACKWLAGPSNQPT